MFPCGDVASEHLFQSYQEQLHIDAPFDETDSDYTNHDAPGFWEKWAENF